MKRQAFTLLEILVVVGVISVLAGIGYPVMQRVSHHGKATACVGNLRQIGIGLNTYLGENNMIFPELRDMRRDKTEEVPVIDNTLDKYLNDPKVLACPADRSGFANRTGTSYFWNVVLNGQAVASVNFLRMTDSLSRIPIVADKEGFHEYSDNRVNILYADGHATKELKFWEEKK